MPSDNVDVLRRAIDAFNRRDIDAVLELSDPEGEFESALVEQQTFRGHAGLRRYVRSLDEAWSEWRTEKEQFIDVGGDRVLQLYRGIGRGKGSGVAIEADLAVLWTLRDGRLLRGRAFQDQREARAAAGLEPA